MTSDLRQRQRQHKYKPPTRMREDAAAHRPFDANFTMTTLHWAATKRLAHALEQIEIDRLNTRYPANPLGANILDGTPGQSRRYWAIYRSRQRRRQ